MLKKDVILHNLLPTEKTYFKFAIYYTLVDT